MASNLQIDEALSAIAQSVKDQNGNTSALTVSTDKVGIGMTNPSATLEVDGRLHLKVPTATSDTPGDSAAYPISISNESIESASTLAIRPLGAGIMHLATDFPGRELRLGGGQFEQALTLKSGGNVGIGTPNPRSKLDVWDGEIYVTGSDHNGTAIVTSSGGNAWFSNNALTNGICINPGGNVGIGRCIPSATLEVAGDIAVTGDVRLLNADCAEDFDISGTDVIEPGTVMVIDQEGVMEPSRQAYDKRVAGVISGAGDLKPGIILGKQPSGNKRVPIALVGKVFCQVDAEYGPIGVGDLLTTSPTTGHAMKADDQARASGAVIGKALRGLEKGRGLIPILVSLQ